MVQDLKNEIWYSVNVEGYENAYKISNLGRLKSMSWNVIRGNAGNFVKKEKLIKWRLSKMGYVPVLLCYNKKKKGMFLHVIIAKTFIPNPENKPQVNHKNGIRHDNRVENLEWCTMSENHLHSFRELGRVSPNKGKSGAQIGRARKVWCDTLGIGFDTLRIAGKELDVNESGIGEVCRGKLLQIKGLTFRYI